MKTVVGRGHSILRRGSHGDKVFTVHMGNNQMLDKVGVINIMMTV